MRPGPARSDPSEAGAARALERDAERARDTGASRRSVFDEPDILPDRDAELIDQDWTCGNCGYNLRGLATGHPCPECGHKELYRPAPRGAVGYESWVRERIAGATDSKAWKVALVLALAGGPFAVIAALFGTEPGGFLAGRAVILAVLFGPVMEETMKIASAALCIETRPYLFRRPQQIYVATGGAALLFAAIENVIYLNVYISNPSMDIILWRWTVCVALHLGCTLVATRGLVEVWRRSVTECRRPRLGLGFSALVTAIIIHAAYNASVTAVEWLASGFR